MRRGACCVAACAPRGEQRRKILPCSIVEEFSYHACEAGACLV